jgi:adenine-specific DNA-methyltransferase
MEKLDLTTPNFTDENIQKLSELFPNCVTEDGNGKAIDFDALKQELSSNIVEGNKERYQLTWPGKAESLVTANTPINKTLRPAREESKDFDNTENLYIEGDNLEVLKLLQETYLGKIKMIYIDPPYNTGKDFVYKDNFTQDKEEFDEESGNVDDEGGRLISNPDSSGRYHSDWLSMMYPRLKLARNLLKDEGVIVIHIDENEYSNLEKILLEIFGEGNNLGTIVWDKRNPKGEVVGVAQQHEQIVLFSKSKHSFASVDFKKKKENADQILSKASALIKKEGGVSATVEDEFKKWMGQHKNKFTGGELAYKFIDVSGDVYRPVSMAAPDKPETRSHRPLIHPVTSKPCPVPAKGWRLPEASMDKLLNNGDVLFGKDETTQPQKKYLLKENLYENISSLLYYGGSGDALGLPFDNPKPITVSCKLIESICKEGDTVMDFFSGSATTAHATMQLNAEDGGNRKFILAQIPQATDQKSEAYKAGYNTITEIGKERIRRAGEKIKDDYADKEGIDDLDIGFRVLKVDSSNMKDVYFSPDNTSQEDLFDRASNIKDERTDEDLLFMVLLDWGIDLSVKIERREVLGKTVYFADDNFLAACFEDNLDEDFAKALAAEQPRKVVLRDSGFASSSVKINIEQIFKQAGIEGRVI